MSMTVYPLADADALFYLVWISTRQFILQVQNDTVYWRFVKSVLISLCVIG
jgi:hypothetical protein